jgi:hypothetical protein
MSRSDKKWHKCYHGTSKALCGTPDPYRAATNEQVTCKVCLRKMPEYMRQEKAELELKSRLVAHVEFDVPMLEWEEFIRALSHDLRIHEILGGHKNEAIFGKYLCQASITPRTSE